VRAPCLFCDDFSDGIWTKHSGNPVLVRDQLWAESDYICEPNVLYHDGTFHMWFAQMFPQGHTTALGYAASADGFQWTKHPRNPVLFLEGLEVHRPSVMKHEGQYFLFAVQNEHLAPAPATMHRWTSEDGIAWADGQLVMRADQRWENDTLSNMAVVVDDDGTWHMLYTGCDEAIDGYFGYARSRDGLRWTKHGDNPVMRGFYGGDPFLARIRDRYYTWHSQTMTGSRSLRICCRWSDDMIHWRPVYNNPQINYSQPWERGVPPEEGGTTAGYYGHLTDATLCEAQGRVFMVYQGAQTPLGVATFDGTFEDLADRLAQPPLSGWKESPYGMVDGCELKIADNETDRDPIVAEVPGAEGDYVLECRVRCYAGPTHRVTVVHRCADRNAFARFWLHDDAHTYYQECFHGLFSTPVDLGANRASDAEWHDWSVEVHRETNRLCIDGRPVGDCRTSAALLKSLHAAPVHVGFGCFDSYVSVDYVRVR